MHAKLIFLSHHFTSSPPDNLGQFTPWFHKSKLELFSLPLKIFLNISPRFFSRIFPPDSCTWTYISSEIDSFTTHPVKYPSLSRDLPNPSHPLRCNNSHLKFIIWSPLLLEICVMSSSKFQCNLLGWTIRNCH